MCGVRRVWGAEPARRESKSPVVPVCQITVRCPIRLDVNPVIDLRITTAVPQRWPARRRYVWGLGVDPDVVQDLLYLRALGDKGDQAHLTTAHRAQEREEIGNSVLPDYLWLGFGASKHG